MPIPPVAIIAVGLVLLFLAFKLIKSVIRTALLALFVMGILFLLGAVIIASDASHLRDTFSNSTKIFLATKDQNVVAGFSIDPKFKAIPENELAVWTAVLKDKSFEKNSSLATRIFVLNESTLLDNPNARISIDGRKTLNRSSLYGVLVAPRPTAAFASLIDATPEVVAAAYAENDLKALIFGYLAQDTLNNKTVFAQAYKSGALEMYPQGPALWAMKHLPLPLVEQSLDNTYITKEVP